MWRFAKELRTGTVTDGNALDEYYKIRNRGNFFFFFFLFIWTLQDRASPVIEQLIFFQNHSLILIIITAVFYTIIRIIENKQTRRFILEGQIIEIIWTIARAVILVFTAIPSVRLLYLIDEIHNPVITLKILKFFVTNTKDIFHFTCCQGTSTCAFLLQKTLKIDVQFCIFIVIFLEIKEIKETILYWTLVCIFWFYSALRHVVIAQFLLALFPNYFNFALWNSNVPRRFNVSC